jgi:iron-sulfur cluster assembly protein
MNNNLFESNNNSNKPAIFSITDNAASRIKELLAQREKEAVGIRVGVKKGGCSGLSYVIEYTDEINKYDEVVSEKGVTVVIEPKAVIYLVGTVMDFVQDKLKSGFIFTNPNAKGHCGCGESFHA